MTIILKSHQRYVTIIDKTFIASYHEASFCLPNSKISNLTTSYNNFQLMCHCKESRHLGGTLNRSHERRATKP